MPSPTRFWSELESSLRDRSNDGLFRSRKTWTHLSPRLVEDEKGQKLINFGSNDYLSLSWYQSPTSRSGSTDHQVNREGAGASPLITGSTRDHDDLVEELARFEQEEDAILFSSGFAANVGVVSAVVGARDIIFSDRLNHASLIDGCRLSRAKTIVYPHNDLESLEGLLKQSRHEGRRAFVVTDSLFSMDGDLPDLIELRRLIDVYDMIGILDEAHATGVYGARGMGLVEHFAAESDRWIRTGTLSKAVGSVGGFVAGPKTLIDWLTNFARSYIYSTAAPASQLRRTFAAIRKLETMSVERKTLRNNATSLRKSLRDLGLRVGGTDSPIIAIYATSVSEVMAWSHRLQEHGLLVPAIRPPTVPDDGCMLRVSMNTSHTVDDFAKLVNALR
ncbi:MAG: aminotransferase class I/II-fold pyridoxal phosphate-dependent enzyme [Pirellula sp.]|jgi:8-amino-7-oxononanoate synthase